MRALRALTAANQARAASAAASPLSAFDGAWPGEPLVAAAERLRGRAAAAAAASGGAAAGAGPAARSSPRAAAGAPAAATPLGLLASALQDINATRIGPAPRPRGGGGGSGSDEGSESGSVGALRSMDLGAVWTLVSKSSTAAGTARRSAPARPWTAGARPRAGLGDGAGGGAGGGGAAAAPTTVRSAGRAPAAGRPATAGPARSTRAHCGRRRRRRDGDPRAPSPSPPPAVQPAPSPQPAAHGGVRAALAASAPDFQRGLADTFFGGSLGAAAGAVAAAAEATAADAEAVTRGVRHAVRVRAGGAGTGGNGRGVPAAGRRPAPRAAARSGLWRGFATSGGLSPIAAAAAAGDASFAEYVGRG